MSLYKKLFLAFFTSMFLYPCVVIAQSGILFNEEDMMTAKELKQEIERKRKEQEREQWVKNEAQRIYNGKQTGIIISFSGSIVSCIGVIVWIINSNCTLDSKKKYY